MNITKIGHCCLLIKTKGITLLTDPGEFTVEQNILTDIDAVLITHEHGDHLHTDSLKEILKNNPNAKVITNTSVRALLNKEGIESEVLEDGSQTILSEVSILGIDGKHEEIFEEFGQVQNTGFFIDNKFLYPGDSFIVPNTPVEVLALPVAGPWCKVSDAIQYALKVKPKKAFPVHDGQLQQGRIGGNHKVPEIILNNKDIEFIPLKNGESLEI